MSTIVEALGRTPAKTPFLVTAQPVRMPGYLKCEAAAGVVEVLDRVRPVDPERVGVGAARELDRAQGRVEDVSSLHKFLDI